MLNGIVHPIVFVIAINLSAGQSASGTIDVTVDKNGPMKFKQVWAMMLDNRAELDGPPWQYTWTCVDTKSNCIVMVPKEDSNHE